jgi:hypothetical protein
MLAPPTFTTELVWGSVQVSEQHQRSVALIEQLLEDRELRRKFRADPAAVLSEHGLADLAPGLQGSGHALRTLEVRESRSSLAGVMMAAAAEGVDAVHLAERALPTLERDAGRSFDRLLSSLHHHGSGHGHRPAKAKLAWHDRIPPLAAGSRQATAAPDASSAPMQLPQTAPASSGSGHAAGALAGAPHTDHAGTGAAADIAAHHHHLLSYPGNDASPQQIAAWMGAHAKRAGLPPELPVMAALTESNLRNLPYGDRDSVGFFQMRESVWNFGPYAGYRDHPARQLKWFIDHALAVRAEDPTLVENPGRWGEWAADIEQPAAQYRFRYQLQLDNARALLRGVDLEPVHVAPHPPVGKMALRVAMHYLGTPYQYGGSSPATGFDCSGLVQYAYAQEGIRLPRVAADQFDVGVRVSRQDLRPGDAVFFADPNGYVHHVGLYIGDGRFINAPRTGEDVKVDSLSEPYFAEQFAGARRYTIAALSDPSKYARTLPTVSP